MLRSVGASKSHPSLLQVLIQLRNSHRRQVGIKMSALLLVQMGWRMWLRPKAQMGFFPSLLMWPYPPTHSRAAGLLKSSQAGLELPWYSLSGEGRSREHTLLVVQSVPEREPGMGWARHTWYLFLTPPNQEVSPPLPVRNRKGLPRKFKSIFPVLLEDVSSCFMGWWRMRRRENCPPSWQPSIYSIPFHKI